MPKTLLFGGIAEGRRASPFFFFCVLVLGSKFLSLAVLKILRSTAGTLNVSGTGMLGAETFERRRK